ncbi:hypothetical protein Q8W37_04750 [Shimia thalassica]|uniref:hypothetical protein n=1 Tax=Shimia thalassica TaxID=1715693 RepID=UPI000C08CCC0|nr:hypothetical protein [Shimia thalassica]PHO04410.1 hypothetical protein CSC82_07030 [Rhodobacteraceae bacterium 4F10]MBU2943637.1 hypothetical protein [Shimia thalassica]MDO6478549.1 hypothetical protein [Shimia thalassica]MDO6484716.1 hypothetical protein [Shimia thalassica]MDO6501708.1 hypothetical protein [Shimia thalassica]
MTEESGSNSTPPGLYDQPTPPRVTGIEVIAVVLSLLWLAGTAMFFLVLGPGTTSGAAGVDGLRFIMTMLAIFLPVAMIWVAATAARSSRIMREESTRLQAAIDAMRRTYVAQSQGTASKIAAEPSVARKLDEIAAAQKKTESALATFSTTRDRSIRKVATPEEQAVPHEDQGLLALGTPAEDLSPPLQREIFINALNFPENAEDKEGFSALRKALKDRQASQLIQAAQDVLTLLSQDGIYMDDLRPDLARPEIWRRFAAGERGKVIAQLGGIRDRSSLALTAGRMKQDPIFRDAAHHFLRRFDRMFVDFEETASDSDIAALSDTRTARAFMLLGRVAGIFD